MKERLEIVPLTEPPVVTVRVPGSKSITNRALVLAALCGTEGCELRGVLRSEDVEMMIGCLGALGFHVETRWSESRIRVYSEERGQVGPIPYQKAELFVGNSGTTMRFVTALVSLGHGRYRLDGIPRMRERPIEDLLSALRQLGVIAHSENGTGCPPVVIESQGLRGGVVRIRGDLSSQFFSGLLMVAPFAQDWITVAVEGRFVSWPYVLMTVDLMKQFGAEVLPTMDSTFIVPAPRQYHRAVFEIEPDASAASYFWGAAAVTGGTVCLPGLTKDSIQGDVKFVELLDQMGCRVERETASLIVHGGPLHGIDVDMNDISDTVMTLGAVALFADGPTTIRNVAHIRHR